MPKQRSHVYTWDMYNQEFPVWFSRADYKGQVCIIFVFHYSQPARVTSLIEVRRKYVKLTVITDLSLFTHLMFYRTWMHFQFSVFVIHSYNESQCGPIRLSKWWQKNMLKKRVGSIDLCLGACGVLKLHLFVRNYQILARIVHPINNVQRHLVA